MALALLNSHSLIFLNLASMDYCPFTKISIFTYDKGSTMEHTLTECHHIVFMKTGTSKRLKVCKLFK